MPATVTPNIDDMAAVDSTLLPTLHSNVAPDPPPSPTLTNPDMILPYSIVGASPTPLASSPTLRTGDMGLSPGPSLAPTPEPEVGVATAVKMPMRFKPPPPSSVAQQNFNGFYEHGAPLSDIGEESVIGDDEHTTPKSKFSTDRRSPSPIEMLSSTPTQQSPTREKGEEVDNASSDGSDLGDWENFDSSKMMTGRLAADIAKDEEEGVDGAESKRNSALVNLSDDRDEMAVLNAKAEIILENARKRLTHMEDNLSKARHSVLWSPRSSPNMSELHQPAGGLYRSISLAGGMRSRQKPLYQTAIKSNLSHNRGLSDSTHTSGGLKRLSMIPETRSSSAMEYSRGGESPLQLHSLRISPGPRHTASSPSSSRSITSPMQILEEEDSPTSTIKTSPEQPGPRGLGINTLANQTKEDISAYQRNTPSPTLVRSASAASQRSLRDQVSDLKVRIADLKAKAQEDKERRQSLQTRNTPSPFNHASSPEQWYASSPEYKAGGSPLNTNAGVGWSPTHKKQLSLDAQLTPITPKNAAFLDAEPLPTGEPSSRNDARTDVNTPNLHKRSQEVITPAQAERVDSVIDDSYYEDAAQQFEEGDAIAASEEEQIYLNEVLEESLHEVEPDVPDIPDQFQEGEQEAERHEDRYDAFDYENMFLHSAMGNYTGTGLRSRSNSESSSSSVETRRANQQTPTANHHDNDSEGSIGSDEEEDTLIIQHHNEEEDDTLPTPRVLRPPPQPWMGHGGRSNSSMSIGSVSSVATFATATEGMDDLDDDDDDDDAPHEILSWGNGSGFPQPPSGTTSPRRNMAGAFPTPPVSARFEQQQQPALRLITGNAFGANGMPTPPTQSPLPSSTATSAKSGRSSRSRSQSTSRPDSQTGHSPRGSQSGNISVNGSNTGSGTDAPGNTEILMESLIKLADPDFQVTGTGNTFAEVDKELVLNLLRAVGGVCSDVLRGQREGGVREVKVLRRRLDEGRRVLEGMGDGE